MNTSDIFELLRALSDDLDVPCPANMAEYWANREIFIKSGLGGQMPISFSEAKRMLYFHEFAYKVCGLEDVTPASSVPSFLKTQQLIRDGTCFHASSRDIGQLRIILNRMIRPSAWRIKDVVEGFRHGPGATHDGLRSVDKWLSCVPDELGDLCDPLGRLPRAPFCSWSRYYDVPKTANKKRGICAEYTVNQFVQQGVGRFIAREIKMFSDVRKQQRNINAARNPESQTLDLSSASDSISVELLQELWPEAVTGNPKTCWQSLAWLSRSDTVLVPVTRDDMQVHKLYTFASMGNGFCFPLLTAVCTAIVILAISRQFDISIDWSTTRGELLRRLELGGASVYGDDIVVSNDVATRTRFFLEVFGFTLNTAKSSQPRSDIRETCGSFFIQDREIDDILRIRDVTGLVGLAHLCDVQRRAHEKSWFALSECLIRLISHHPSYGDVVMIPAALARNLDLSSCLVVTDPHCKARIKSVRDKKLQVEKWRVASLSFPERKVNLAGPSAWAASLWDTNLASIPETEISGQTPVVRRKYVRAGSRL